MKQILVALCFLISSLSQAEIHETYSLDPDMIATPVEKPLCDGLSDFRCVNKKMDSTCLQDAQKGAPGLCRPVEAAADDSNEVTCRCI